MPDTEKIKTLLKEIQKLKTFEKIKSTKDFDAVVDVLKLIFDRFSVAKGDKGDVPQKGIDYWTESEVNKTIREIAREVQAIIRMPKDGEKGRDGKSGKDGRNGKNGSDGRDGIDGKDGLNGADGSPDTPEIIKQKLESLNEKDKLPIQAIKDLEKRLEELKKTRGEKVYIGGGSSGGLGGHVQYYDLSSQLNGNLRVFSVPAFARILNVQLSSFPNILRPVVDWTSDAAAMTLTLTSEIPDSSISSGQTLVVLYATL